MLYLADQEDDELFELYLAELDDVSDASVFKASGDTQGRSVRSFQWSPVGDKALFLAGDPGPGSAEAFFVNLELSVPTAPEKINGTLPVAQDGTPVGDVVRARFAPDGEKIAYLADENQYGVVELFLSDLSFGSPSAPQEVNLDLPTDADVRDFAWSPDGSALVYRADQDTQALLDIYYVDTSSAAPGTPIKITPGVDVAENGALTTGYAFSPDGSQLYYRADQEGTVQLYWVDLSGGSPADPVRLNDLLDSTSNQVVEALWSPDSSKILFRADPTHDQHHLFLVDLSAGSPGPAVDLTPDLSPEGTDVLHRPVWSPDSSRIAFHARPAGTDEPSLYVVDVGGASPSDPVELSAGADFATSYAECTALRWAPSGASLAYGAAETDAPLRLYVADFESSADPTPQAVGGSEEPVPCPFFWSPDAAALLYRGQVSVTDPTELFVADVASPGSSDKVNGPLTLEGEVEQVALSDRNFAWSPTGEVMVYLADEVANERFELFAVPRTSPGSSSTVNDALGPGGNVTDFAWEPQ